MLRNNLEKFQQYTGLEKISSLIQRKYYKKIFQSAQLYCLILLIALKILQQGFNSARPRSSKLVFKQFTKQE